MMSYLPARREKKAKISALLILIIYIITVTTGFVRLIQGAETVRAEYSAYARIITEDTPFYRDKEGLNLLFYLPYTYYVRVLDDSEPLSHVECYGLGGTAAIDGYVPSAMLFYDGLSVKNPYADVKITATSTTVLYSDRLLTQAIQYIFDGRMMNYYGTLPITDDVNAFYVSYNDRLGYVKESEVLPFTIPNHPNELTFIEPEDPVTEPPETDGEDGKTTDGGGFDLRILIIACLAFAGIIALFIVFRKKPSARVAAGYYDENDYE